MRTLNLPLLLVALAAPLLAEETYPKIATVSDAAAKEFPAAALAAGPDKSIHIVTDGTRSAESALYARLLGPNTVAVDLDRDYDYGGEARKTRFQLIYYSLETVAAGSDAVKRGDVIGTGDSGQVRLVIASDKLDEYLVLGSSRFPVKFGGKYWYFPGFLFPNGPTAFLSFRTCADIDKALSGVAAEASESPGYVFYPDYRIRFQTTLAAQPQPLSAEDKANIASYENNFYGKTGLYVFQNEVVVDGYRYLFCWQGKFDKYLGEEYTPGTPVWLFGNIVTYDAFNKVGYVFLRDFSLLSVETMIENRLKALK